MKKTAKRTEKSRRPSLSPGGGTSGRGESVRRESGRRGPIRGAAVRRPKAPLSTSGKGLKSRARKIASVMLKEYPQAKTALKHKSPLQLLVATILSAQCTDVRVNAVTRELFKKYKTASDFAAADPGELEQEIHSLGFFRQKARSIVQCCKDIGEKHGDRVPDTMEGLTSLRGVGRKTANVVLGNVHGTPVVVVDTHVRRLSLRLGLTRNTNPDHIEQDLMNLLPENAWRPFSDALILHGRAVCASRKPLCEACVVDRLCPSSIS